MTSAAVVVTGARQDCDPRQATAYVCFGPQCSLPVTEPRELVETIKTARQVTVT